MLDGRRRAMIAKVHVLKRDAGLDDAAYRATLERVAGAGSCRDMTEKQLARVLDALGAAGRSPPPRDRAGIGIGPKLSKAWACAFELTKGADGRHRPPRARAYLRSLAAQMGYAWGDIQDEELRDMICALMYEMQKRGLDVDSQTRH